MNTNNQQQSPAPHPALVAIDVEPVTSSQIAAIGYDADTRTLQVDFPGESVEKIYQYPYVNAETFAEFQASGSKGSYFYTHIKQLPFNRFTRATGALEKSTAGADEKAA
jgi:hypothetical protein